jgi:dTMP kinase
VKPGRFITLEGIEGAGKSTVAKLVREWLTARGVTVVATREPGGTPLAERVRNLVLDRGGEPITPTVETLLMFAGRGIHVNNLIRPALARGEWVVCDRFTDATRAYQGAGRGVSREWIEQLATAVQNGLQPDRTLLLVRGSAPAPHRRIVSRKRPKRSSSACAPNTCAWRGRSRSASPSSMPRKIWKACVPRSSIT